MGRKAKDPAAGDGGGELDSGLIPRSPGLGDCQRMYTLGFQRNLQKINEQDYRERAKEWHCI